MKMHTKIVVVIAALCLTAQLRAEGPFTAIPIDSHPISPVSLPPAKGVGFSFNAAGWLNVTLNGATVASGAPVLQGLTPILSHASLLSATRGTIVQTYSNPAVTIDHNCVLNGDDLTITSHITNNAKTPTSPITITYPPFKFNGTPTGTIPSWHSSYLQLQGTSIFHPSMACPIGCVHASDGKYAIAAWSPSELARPSLIQGQWIKDSVLSNPLPIELHTVDSVAAGAAIDVSMTLRVTTDLSTNGLLSGYKAMLPAMSYTARHKPTIEACSVDSSWITPSDPFGYNGAFRRLDLLQGASLYVKTVTPLLKSSGGSGVIFWAPGGFQSSSWYPVDFDVNLKRIASTWPTTVSGLKNAGFRVGMCARIGDALGPNNAIRRADPTNASDVSTMLTRLDYCAKTGVTMWYLDSTCEDPSSTQMLAIAAKHLGAGHVFYSEYANDISLAYSGAYCEWVGAKTYWLTEPQRAELMALYPDSDWICVDRTGKLTAASLESKGLWPLTLD